MKKGIDDRETAQGVTHEDLIRSGTIGGVDMWHQFIADKTEELFTAAGTAEAGAVNHVIGIVGDMSRREIAHTVCIGDGYYNELRETHGTAALA